MTAAAQPLFTFHVRPLGEDERSFAYGTWARDYLSSRAMRAVPQTRYHVGMSRLMQRVMRRATVLVAEDDKHPLFYGWIAVELEDDEPVVHYMYVKADYRHRGIGRGLVLAGLEAMGIAPSVRSVVRDRPRNVRIGDEVKPHVESQLECGHTLLTGQRLKGVGLCGVCTKAKVRFTHIKDPARHWANALGWQYDPFPAYV